MTSGLSQTTGFKKVRWQSRSLHTLSQEINLRKEKAFIQRAKTNQPKDKRNNFATKDKGDRLLKCVSKNFLVL